MVMNKSSAMHGQEKITDKCVFHQPGAVAFSQKKPNKVFRQGLSSSPRVEF